MSAMQEPMGDRTSTATGTGDAQFDPLVLEMRVRIESGELPLFDDRRSLVDYFTDRHHS